ncbi:hypothetical protein O4J56_31445 [Nocardiopsis sp. RSe5-2]|uniref:Lipoprotein n=1 Tax=Nocardiopsis endophytica TaxID=3018445 RepID=A0ABT4UDY9_9ACTN|nr:hypothetical protein [Nocardiopsis endophytica]MDA2815199.1 hypothetical protein [Nocardiopsis endophytica]
MKPTRTIAAAAAVLAAAAGCTAGGEAAPSPSPSSPTRSPSSQPPSGSGPPADVAVFNTHGDEGGYADREPEALTASEFTTFNDLEWTRWGAEGAEGEGDLSGTWCLPECQDDPYRVPVELADPQEFGGGLYFTRYEVGASDELPDEQRTAMEEADGGMLMRPGG